MVFTRRAIGLCILSTFSALVACAPAAEEEIDGDSAEVNEANGGPKLCAAVRGNGQSIVTHFASLARITEHYGVIDGIAGGSSGSITTFAYESILKNPNVATCGERACGAAEKAERVALALKSVQGYGEALVEGEEGVAIGNLVSVIGRLKTETEKRGIAGLIGLDTLRAARALIEVLEIPEVRSLVNPEVFKMLRDSSLSNLAFSVREIHTAITTLGAFSVDDNRLFFRTGILDWNSLAMLFGRVADFYAGFAPAEPKAIGAWLDRCASATAGKPWDQASKVAAPSGGGTCGEQFQKIVSDYRAKVKSGNVQSRRLNEKVGSGPLHKLVTTAVLEGKGIDAWKKGREAYLTGDHAKGDIPFAISFSDVKFGYWGSKSDLDTVSKNLAKNGDLKSKKMSSLGDQATWKEILTASPAEPGLSRFVQLSDGRLSAGGWSDLAPTLALEAMGCEKTIYVTREGDESGFAAKIAKELGMTESDWKGLYDLNAPKSAYNVSLEHASAVWCTNWNAFGDTQQREMSLDAYNAPIEVRGTLDALKPYSRTTARTGKPGCTPGISGGAKFPTQ